MLFWWLNVCNVKIHELRQSTGIQPIPGNKCKHVIIEASILIRERERERITAEEESGYFVVIS